MSDAESEKERRERGSIGAGNGLVLPCLYKREMVSDIAMEN